VPGKASYSPQERSTTGNPSEVSPCSYTGDGSLRGETSNEEVSDGRDLAEEGGGGESLPDEDEDPLT
jgi:hypothetical protein